MTLIVDLTAEESVRLREAAKQQGMKEEEYARRLIASHLPDAKSLALAKLMEQWIKEDATKDPEERDRREAEWEELERGLEANRAATGERALLP